MKNLLTAVFFYFLIVVANGQSYVFKVLASKGEIEYKSSSEGTWKPVSTGTSLQSGDILKILEQAYLGLVHHSGHTQELTDPGTFRIDDLSAKMGSQKSGLASRYSEFVLNRINEVKNGDALKATGAVTRSVDKSEINLISPISSEVFSDRPILYWNGDEKETYLVQVKDMFDETLFEKETTGNSFQMDLGIEKLKEQQIFFVSVVAGKDPQSRSNPVGLERLSDERLTEIESQLQQLDEEVKGTTSLGQLVIGGYFEENNLLIDAQNHYLRAIELSPEVVDYQLLYQDFLTRHKMGGND